jgi:hypothetical protein
LVGEGDVVRNYRVLALAVCFVVLFAPSPSEAASVKALDDRCIINGYVPSSSGDHVSQLANNSIMFGTQLFIETDCGGYTIYIDDGAGVLVGENQTFFSNVSTSTRTVFIEGDGFNMTWVNLQFWPANMFNGMMLQYQNELVENDGDYWTAQSLRSHEFFVAIVTVFAALLFSLFVVERVSGFLHSRSIGKEITGAD